MKKFYADLPKIFFLTIIIASAGLSQISTAQSKDTLKSGKESSDQKKKNLKKKTKQKKELSFMDKVQQIIELRRSFDISDEITKPALLSFKKDENDPAVFLVHVALAYKGFRYEESGVTPSVQFDYSTKDKDKLEKLRFGLDTYYRLYSNPDNSGKLQPFITFSRDFASKIDELKFNLSFIPSFPKFLIPVRNISSIKFNYDGDDDEWVFGLNPVFGATFERSYGGNKNLNRTDYYTLTAASVTVKKYYFQFDLFGKYEKEFIQEHDIRYKYEATATLYFDEKERSSINAKFEQTEKDKLVDRRITLGFGIKL